MLVKNKLFNYFTKFNISIYLTYISNGTTIENVQHNQTFLDVNSTFFLICITYLKSDCSILVTQKNKPYYNYNKNKE